MSIESTGIGAWSSDAAREKAFVRSAPSVEPGTPPKDTPRLDGIRSLLSGDAERERILAAHEGSDFAIAHTSKAAMYEEAAGLLGEIERLRAALQVAHEANASQAAAIANDEPIAEFLARAEAAP